MWLLLIVLLTPIPGISRATVLNYFETLKACQPERDRVGSEIAKSYPDETDFRIVCEFLERRPRVMPDQQPREEQAALPKERV